MKGLTTEQKIALLEEVKRLLIEDETIFICATMEYIMSQREHRNYIDYRGVMDKYVPEILKYRPKDQQWTGWFEPENKESRIIVIDKTIKDLKKSISPSCVSRIISTIKRVISKWERN